MKKTKPKSLWKTKQNHSRKSFHWLLQLSASSGVAATPAVFLGNGGCASGWYRKVQWLTASKTQSWFTRAALILSLWSTARPPQEEPCVNRHPADRKRPRRLRTACLWAVCRLCLNAVAAGILASVPLPASWTPLPSACCGAGSRCRAQWWSCCWRKPARGPVCPLPLSA